jgi:hypothetical protein
MRITFAAVIAMTATSVHGYTCATGAVAYTFVQAAGINVARINCNHLPGVFEAEGLPKNPDDPAQAYQTQLRELAICGEAEGCSVFCKIPLVEDLADGVNTLIGEQRARCEASGGSYTSKLL